MKVGTKCKRAATFFPKHLKRIREASGLSKNALSEIAGLSPSYLVRLEKGERNPTLETLIRLAHGLEISLTDLIQGIDDVTSD